jgi:hypothetical protein
MNENAFFETSDLALASALCCVGASLDGLDKTNPRRAVFIFRREKGLDDLIAAYWGRTLKVDAMGYFLAQKQLKARLYEPFVEY